ncbi:MAG: hypothetical protein KGL39_36495 [Patescibacteria group bacterium]|nr:hypothetical protein [Patescibacteria group bacterium]
MAKNFGIYATSPYLGTPFSVPYVNKAVRLSTGIWEKYKAAVVQINWIVYGARAGAYLGVSVNLDTGNQPRNVVQQIESVVIDNTSSEVNIYVFFPDTGYTATCAPNSIVSVYVLTNVKQAVIYGDNFSGNTIPQTNVYFLEKYVDYYNIQTYAPSVPDIVLTPLVAANPGGATSISGNIGKAAARTLLLILEDSQTAGNFNPTLAGIHGTTIINDSNAQAMYLFTLQSSDPSGTQTIAFGKGARLCYLTQIDNLIGTVPLLKQKYIGNFTSSFNNPAGAAFIGFCLYTNSAASNYSYDVGTTVVSTATNYLFGGSSQGTLGDWVWDGLTQQYDTTGGGGPGEPANVRYTYMTVWR